MSSIDEAPGHPGDVHEDGPRAANLRDADDNDPQAANLPLDEQLRRTRQLLKTRTYKLEAQTRALELLSRIGAVVASELELEQMLQTVVDEVRTLTGAEFGAFFHNTVDEQGGALTLSALSGAPREAFARCPMPRMTAIFEPTFHGERIVRLHDVHEDPAYGKSPPYFGMPGGHLPVRSYLAAPVVSRSGQVHGGLMFGHAQPGRFQERHEQILSGVASQVAVAIDNARLLEQAEHSRCELRAANEALERKVIERGTALQRTELQFDQLVNGINDCAIFMMDSSGHIVSWNPGAERIKGYTAAEVLGKHFSIFYTEQERAAGAPARSLAIAARDGKFETEAWRVRKDGTRFWASVLIDAIRAPGGALRGYAKITRDMTEKRAIQEQLHQSQKMESIGQLTGGVAHDFNNLLTVILGNLDTVAREMPASEGRLRRALDNAVRGAQRAATLTQQLLAFSRRQPLNPKPTDVNRLVAGVSELIRHTLREDIAVETVLGGGLWRVDIDAHQLESALLNLAVNARDAMPQGGKLTIETANAHLDDGYAARYAEIAPGQYVVICVSDTGTGMSSDVMARAFDPFFTTKGLGEGTGLGLSQVFGFVKQSGGHVKLYSEPGHGTTVKIYLPRLLGQAMPVEADVTPIVPEARPGETILVVEDDDDVRMYSAESLRELGFTVLKAHDCGSALQALDQHPEVDLLFTDVGLPGKNGRELVDEVHRRRPGLKVLFTTGYARNAIVHQDRLDPGVELLTKPFTRAQLASRIRDVLDAPDLAPGRHVALIVDDEPLVRMFLADTLSQVGFAVAQTATAREGLATAERLRNVEVAFVDVGLPDRSGMDLATELRQRWAAMRIAIASGYDESLPEALSRDGRVTFLPKPFDAAAVHAALSALNVDLAGQK